MKVHPSVAAVRIFSKATFIACLALFGITVNCNPADVRGNSKDGGNAPTSSPPQSRRRTMPTNGIKVAMLVIKPRTSL